MRDTVERCHEFLEVGRPAYNERGRFEQNSSVGLSSVGLLTR